MALQPLAQRVLVSHARPQAFVDKTVAILGRLGYQIHPSERFVEEEARLGDPELVIVEESRLGDLEEPGPIACFADLPRIVLTGRQGYRRPDPHVVGAIHRPAGLHDLYRVIQQVFEDTPRTTPRVPTDLRVVCGRNGETFDGALLSISENGGLLRCDAELPLGSSFQMELALPRAGALCLRAEAAYQLVPHTGVVFSGLAPSARTAIGEFVTDVLLQ